MNATKQATHTPGPLSIERLSDTERNIILRDGPLTGVVARVGFDLRSELVDQYANLFAAAPDLLAALQSLLPWMHLLGDHIGNGVLADPHGHGVPIGDDERCRAILRVRAVIDRATGYA